MSEDVVADLNGFLSQWEALGHSNSTLSDATRRAIAEIVAMRETVERQRLVLSKGHAEVRAEALEEAARACVGSGAIVAEARLCASAIRARALIQCWKDCEQYVGQHISLSTNFETLFPVIAADLAAARREGAEEMRERALIAIAEQRCERGTPWDLALQAALAAVRALCPAPHARGIGMSDDVVAELESWQLYGDPSAWSMLQRARAEIVALRKLTDGDWVWQQITSTRDEALEEAARLHENIDPACDHERQKGHPGAGAMGAVSRYRDAIRALKEKRGE